MAADGSPAEDDDRDRRRLLLLLLVALLVVVGAGIGTFIIPFDGGGPPPATTPTPTETTTGTATASATPDDGTPTDSPATPTDSPSTPTTTATPTETVGGDPGDGGDGDTPGDGTTPTPTATPPPSPTPTPTPSPGLEVSDGPLLSASNLVPGETGQGTLTLGNAAGEDGNLSITGVDLTDDENGITDAESDVDSSPNEGELSEHLEVRVAIEDDAGDRTYVLGTDGGYVSLSDLSSNAPSTAYELENGEDVTLVADWRLPSSTGNVVQSDRVEVTLEFLLESSS